MGKWNRGARDTHCGARPAFAFVKGGGHGRGESAGARLRALGRSARAGGEITRESERIVFSASPGRGRGVERGGAGTGRGGELKEADGF